MIQQLANAILTAANTRESSFDHTACNKAQQLGYPIDYNQFYQLTLKQACDQTDPDLAMPVYLLLYSNWNDAIDWAESITKAPLHKNT